MGNGCSKNKHKSAKETIQNESLVEQKPIAPQSLISCGTENTERIGIVPTIVISTFEEVKEEMSEYLASKVGAIDLSPRATMSNIVPAIGKPAPQFKGMAVVNGEFKEISLADYKGKYVVFFFYPLDFTFVCPTEIIAFSDRVKEFRDIGVEVIGCSTDSHFSHFAWINTPRKQGGLGNMDIPLLADKNCSVAKSYGVYLEEEGVTFRGLFIIDPKQNLRQVTINDLPVGRSVDETLRLVQAFQFTDKHGEVCPAGWKPGDKTMKADVHKSKEYFASA
ncbi:peroxiredoxin 2-like [Artemia franciscana]|uniref:peroxiredoxin 2-like n=1 Tax=Artemia franciscana TaxID=6661 RepID=UPI0032D9FAFB